MLFHGSGAVGRIAVSGRQYIEAAPLPATDYDFTSSIPNGWTFTRASTNATNSTYLDGPTITTYTTYPLNVPRFMAFGLLMEPARTNLFLNSEAPATQTITVAVGTYVLWALGKDIAVVPGTAVLAPPYDQGTGSSPGAFAAFTVSTAGTVIVTPIAGTLRVQFERGASPTSYIPTTGTAQTRAEDRLYGPIAGINKAEGTYFVEFMWCPGSSVFPESLTGQPAARLLTAGTASFVNDYASDILRAYAVSGINATSCNGINDSGGGATSASNLGRLSPLGNVSRVAFAISSNFCAISTDASLVDHQNNASHYRPAFMSTVTLGCGGADTMNFNGFIRSFKYWPTALTDAQLQTITTPGYFRSKPVFEFDLTSGVLPRRLSFYRGISTGYTGIATDSKYTDAPGSTYNTYGSYVYPTNSGGAGVPRMFGSSGLLIEPTKQNMFGNSNAPVTRATGSLTAPNTPYLVWIIGTGSVMLTNGTGTIGSIVGPNPVVAGTVTYVTMSVTGSITCTITGSVNRVQVENNSANMLLATPTTFTQVAAVSTRGGEYLKMPVTGWFNMKERTAFIECTHTGIVGGDVNIISFGETSTNREYINTPISDVISDIFGTNAVTRETPGNIFVSSMPGGGFTGINKTRRFAYATSRNPPRLQIIVDGRLGEDRLDSASAFDPPAYMWIGTSGYSPSNNVPAMYARRVRYYDYALTNDELTELTMGGGQTLDLNFMNPGVLDTRITFTRASVGTYFNSSGIMQTAAINAPRWDYDPATFALNGLLIEEQRINSLLNSAALSTQNVTVTAVAYTLSFYGTGTITLSGVATGSLTGTGTTRRVSMTFTPTAGSLTLTVTGSVTSAQLEVGQFVTSYIPTTSAAVTRSADVCNILGTGWLSPPSGGGTCLVEAIHPQAQTFPSLHSAFAIGKLGVGTDRLQIVIGSPTNMSGTFVVNNSTTSSISYGQEPIGSVWRAAMVFGTNVNYGSINGSISAHATTAVIPTNVDGLSVGHLTNGVAVFNGHIRRIVYWPRMLPDAELQAVTKVGS